MLGRKIRQLDDPTEVVLLRSLFHQALYINGNQKITGSNPVNIFEIHQHVKDAPLTIAIGTLYLTDVARREGFTFPKVLGDIENHQDVKRVEWAT